DLGESIASNLAKSGYGFLQISGNATYSGTTTVNSAGGSIILGGLYGALLNSSGITVNIGGSVILDNTAGNNNDSLRNSSAISMQGGSLILVGNAAGTQEVLGATTLVTNTNSVLQSTSTFVSQSTGAGLTSMSIHSLARNANAYAEFRGYGSDLGS